MAQRRMIECKHKGCINLTRNECGYCDEHKKEYDDRQQELKHKRNKIYNINRDKDLYNFYRSTRWRKIREVALVRDNFLCQDCLKEKKIIQAEHVHHIKEVKDAWELRYDLDNLISLCQSCHNKRHGS